MLNRVYSFLKMNNYNDQELTEAIKAGGEQLDAALQHVYYKTESRERFFTFVKSKNGSLAEAEDVYMEGLFIFYTNIQKDVFKGQSSLQTYLFGICNNLWLSTRRKEIRRAEIRAGINELETEQEMPLQKLLMKEKESLLTAIFSKIGEKCKELLSLARLGYSATEIAEKTGYKNENVVGKKKNFCINVLRELMLDQPHLVKILLEN